MSTKPTARHRLTERASREGPHPGARQATGQTTARQAQKRVPRLPHERDQSADSQTQVAPEQQEVMRQAQKDVERGLQDTSKAEATDAVYRRNFAKE